MLVMYSHVLVQSMSIYKDSSFSSIQKESPQANFSDSSPDDSITTLAATHQPTRLVEGGLKIFMGDMPQTPQTTYILQSGHKLSMNVSSIYCPFFLASTYFATGYYGTAIDYQKLSLL